MKSKMKSTMRNSIIQPKIEEIIPSKSLMLKNTQFGFWNSKVAVTERSSKIEKEDTLSEKKNFFKTD